jgi:PleD family two-component response regulator
VRRNLSNLSPEKGPVLLVTGDRHRERRVRQILAAERFEVNVVADAADVLAGPADGRRAPTVVLLDWSLHGEPGPEELVCRLRPRRAGPRVIAIAARREAPALARLRGISGVVEALLDAEELVDLVWRCHHEVVEARGVV